MALSQSTQPQGTGTFDTREDALKGVGGQNKKVKSKVLVAEVAAGNITIKTVTTHFRKAVSDLIATKASIPHADAEIQQAQTELIELDKKIDSAASEAELQTYETALDDFKTNKEKIISLNGWLIISVVDVERNIQRSIKKLLGGGTPPPNNLHQKETQAETSVAHAESTETQTDHDTAKNLVDNLPDSSTVKRGLLGRLARVQTAIDTARNLATQETAAEGSVGHAEANKTQANHDNAKRLVDGLPTTSTKKAGLDTRLAAVQTNIDARRNAILDIDLEPVTTFTKGEKIEIPYKKGVRGVKINSDIGLLGTMEAGDKKVRITQSLPLGQHEVQIELEDPLDVSNNRTETITINIVAQALLNYPCNLNKKEMYVGDDLYMDLKPPVGTKAVIEYEESPGTWQEYQTVEAMPRGYNSSTKIDVPQLANVGNHNFRTYLIDANTLVPLPKGSATYASTKTVKVKDKPLDGMERINIPQQLDCFEGDASMPLRLSHTPLGAKIKIVDEAGTATITSTPDTTATGTTNIRIAGIDTSIPGEQYIIVTVEDPVPPNNQKEERVKITVKPKKMSLKGILPDFGVTTLPKIHKGNPVKLPALATTGITNAQAILSGPGIPVDTKISINSGDTIDVPGLDTNTPGTKQIRVTLIDPHYANEKSNTATLSITVDEAYSRPNLVAPEWTLGDSKKPEAKLDLLAPNARVRLTYPNQTAGGGRDTKDMNTGTGGSLSTVLDRFNPRDINDRTIRVEYIDALGAPIPGTEVEIETTLKPKSALTRPEGLPAQVALAGHDQKITLKLKQGQTAILDDGHGHPIAGLPTGQPDEYSFAIPYAHPHRHRYENTPSTYNIRISDATGTTLTPDFPVRVTDEIPPIKGTLAHSALSSIKNSTTKNGTLDIHDYRSPHDGTRLRPGVITWNKQTAWKGPFAKYEATIDGPHGLITVKPAKTPEELVKNIKHELDHLYEHEMLEYCNVFNKPVPEALKHHEEHKKPGEESGGEKPKDAGHAEGHKDGEEHESKIKTVLKNVAPYVVTGAVVGGGALAIGANVAGLSLMTGPIGWSAAAVGVLGYGVYKYIWGKKKDGGDDHGHGH